AVRVRPGGLELYLEIVGLEHIRRAIYKASSSLRVRYDDRLVQDLEHAVGPGLVRLLGHRGATTRIDPSSPVLMGGRPGVGAAPTLTSAPDDLAHDDLDDL
ncbi:MAG TPA: hypothetical protein VKE74_03860, partial [Gemmataceae bacterium]|nr:hypothetical protein [Gemmataceae bacterium]